MSYSLSFTKSILVIIFISDKVERNQFEFLSTAEISKFLSIPKPTLVKILQNLNMADIIETKEGKQGGIRLMKDPSKITVLEVFEAMEKGKPLFQTSFEIMAKGKRPKKAQDAIKSILIESESKFKKELSDRTIGDVLLEMNS
jgi:Rrf2 family iron-sulfur cluster assembly transcriptional regulator